MGRGAWRGLKRPACLRCPPPGQRARSGCSSGGSLARRSEPRARALPYDAPSRAASGRCGLRGARPHFGVLRSSTPTDYSESGQHLASGEWPLVAAGMAAGHLRGWREGVALGHRQARRLPVLSLPGVRVRGADALSATVPSRQRRGLVTRWRQGHVTSHVTGPKGAEQETASARGKTTTRTLAPYHVSQFTHVRLEIPLNDKSLQPSAAEFLHQRLSIVPILFCFVRLRPMQQEAIGSQIADCPTRSPGVTLEPVAKRVSDTSTTKRQQLACCRQWRRAAGGRKSPSAAIAVPVK